MGQLIFLAVILGAFIWAGLRGIGCARYTVYRVIPEKLIKFVWSKGDREANADSDERVSTGSSYRKE